MCGMFDTIKDKLYCPYCGTLSEENEYQTKDLSCMLDSWNIKDLLNFNKGEVLIYDKCKKCDMWVEIKLDCK